MNPGVRRSGRRRQRRTWTNTGGWAVPALPQSGTHPLGKYIYPCPQCSGSVIETDPDSSIQGSVHWITDRDPVPVSGSCSYLQWLSRCSKKINFSRFVFWLVTYLWVNFHQSSKKTSLRNHKTLEIKVFLKVFLQMITDLDLDQESKNLQIRIRNTCWA